MPGQARSILTSAKRVALVGLLALASHALLPYLHVLTSSCGPSEASCSSEGQAPSHSSDCAVCGAIAHGGARAVDAPAALAVVSAPLALHAAALELSSLPPSVELDPACARGPPASPRSA
jgi:hypothetical protein